MDKKIRLPAFIYGTAWKEEKTADLVKKAISAGFWAIDSANQKKHYREDFVGDALQALFASGVKRDVLFLQSKFTYEAGQDSRLPYNPKDPFAKQVQDSFQSSLDQLHTDYLDSYLLHGPSSAGPLQPADWEVWRTLEALLQQGKTKAIGVSNFNSMQLAELCAKAKYLPNFVQNRCYAVRGWDKPVREICENKKIIYQGFSLLTANPQVLESEVVYALAQKYKATIPQIVFAFCRQIGILPLTGTTNTTHMRQDLESVNIKLTLSEEEDIFAIT